MFRDWHETAEYQAHVGKNSEQTRDWIENKTHHLGWIPNVPDQPSI